MANLKVLDAAGDTKYLKESGAGTDIDPHVGQVESSQLPASLAAGGGLKVEGVADGVAVPVSIGLPASLVYGQTVVTTAGTHVALGAAATLTSGIRIKALHANTGYIYVGLDGVAAGTGFVLDAGEEVFLEIADRATVFIDSSVNGDGVSYIGS